MFGREKAQPRIVVKERPGDGMYALSVICDTVTGVHYLAADGNGLSLSCMTPLLDENGHVVIDKHLPE